MNILIFGASGYAGSEIKRVLACNFPAVFGTYHTQSPRWESDSSMVLYQLGNEEALFHILLKVNPDVIISCLRGDYDLQIQAHETMANFLTAKGGGRLLYLSTANVFDGALEAAHEEGDEPRAKSEYGMFKIRCEQLLRRALGDNAVLLRIPQIYGRGCPRLIELTKAVQAREPIATLRNFFANYTTNLQIAQWCAHIVEHNLTGTFHIGTKDVCDYVDFQRELIERLNLGDPIFEIAEEPQRLVQAVLPGRAEIPDSLQMKISDVIRQMAQE